LLFHSKEKRMLILHHLTYVHLNQDVLFDNLHLSLQGHEKAALIGNNGSGKSTLLKIMAGLLPPSGGQVQTASRPYYVPQLFEQYNDLTIARALGIADQLQALHDILEGRFTEANLTLLNDDWTLDERCREALAHWGLEGLDLNQQMHTLSGGQKTKIFLAGIAIHQPAIVLLDEPSNHLDTNGRHLLYDYVRFSKSTLLVVSHDRQLLRLLDPVLELSQRGITAYGGNYDFYKEQKRIESQALNEELRSKEKALRKAKETERETAERQQKLDARGKKKQEKAGVPKIVMNTLRNQAENSTSRLKGVHAEKVGTLSQELSELRASLPDTDQMKLGFDQSALHKGKILVEGQAVNYGYGEQLLWEEAQHFRISSGERIALKGLNGSGKTTLIRLILGEIEPQVGTVHKASSRAVYIDQEYSLIDNRLSVYEQAQRFNATALQEHEVKIRLNRFLFPKDVWDKPSQALSGGEKMRLMLCCLTISQQAPDIIVLDEPTNNLDLQNIEILTAAINEYRGTLIVVSHDETFMEQVHIERTITLA